MGGPKLISEDSNGIKSINRDFELSLADKFVEEYFKTLDKDKIDASFKEISDEFFEKYSDSTYLKKYKSGYSREYTSLYKKIQNKFKEKYTDAIEKRIDELLDSDAYKKKIDKVCDELVNYAIDGYKEDLSKRIRERLVSNVVDNEPGYNGSYLRDIIRQEIGSMLGNYPRY